MAIIDKRLEFADGVSVAAGAGTALIGDVIDLGSDARDIGVGKPLYVVLQCATSIITGGAAGTIKFQLASDAQAAIATNGDATVHHDTGTFVTDGDDANDLDAGDLIAVFPLPRNGANVYERYLGILAVIATTTVTAGAINAFITDVPPSGWVAYPDADN